MIQQTRDEWVPCPSGEFRRLAGRLRRRRQRRVFLRAAGAAAAAVVGGGAVGLWLRGRPTDQTPPGGLTCEQARTLADAYGKGQLDAAQHEQVRTHLVGCARGCAAWFQHRGLTWQSPDREGDPLTALVGLPG